MIKPNKHRPSKGPFHYKSQRSGYRPLGRLKQKRVQVADRELVQWVADPYGRVYKCAIVAVGEMLVGGRAQAAEHRVFPQEQELIAIVRAFVPDIDSWYFEKSGKPLISNIVAQRFHKCFYDWRKKGKTPGMAGISSEHPTRSPLLKDIWPWVAERYYLKRPLRYKEITGWLLGENKGLLQ